MRLLRSLDRAVVVSWTEEELAILSHCAQWLVSQVGHGEYGQTEISAAIGNYTDVYGFADVVHGPRPTFPSTSPRQIWPAPTASSAR
jgi:hypothetical protein